MVNARRLLAPLALAAALFSAACETLTPISMPTRPPATQPTQPPRGDSRIGGPIDFGQYAMQEPQTTASRFQSQMSRRYGPGQSLPVVWSDLRGQGFVCSPPSSARGDPPDQACRKRVMVGGCEYTWQVMTYDSAGDQRLARLRSLFDRRCGRDGLLGGPV